MIKKIETPKEDLRKKLELIVKDELQDEKLKRAICYYKNKLKKNLLNSNHSL